ncbi:GNAT family N-acetyltransferase [Cupriavidus taiwanensis]|uniref:GNAT family N-acetyltransferase n=1 Tax=Cupriavidus taiwanensis TaxID=164546 RepID=UPI000E10A6D3|nr:GNAT family N-acetyltransferase [Cupriavidus taiwanensis]SOY72638.1 putative Acyl-CoA N-acyltransferase [Cupriavidus taiwanensis]SOY72831.1 putative Acyl-CoA N-acyltransferase [Cupriavidus taiwanensis]SOY96745.1 putative Acyl-CoA N-acyltransferase [Cupriavidus taiwanensis]SOZ66662.1 putative Acyl-CoA N-acyltransferase [Cupriavidus taiwanensis]SOZ83901.1 putative Acyl-CoA N-acyltransferase [Cupriavidus taiwanensis]
MDLQGVARGGETESWTAGRGTQVTLRRTRAQDGAALRAMVDALSRESRYFRFLTGGRVVDEIVAGLAAPGDGGVALVVVAPGADGSQAIVASAEYVLSGRIAEFAVVVADAWQGQGLGRRLIARLCELARAAGLHGLRGDVLSENRRMLAILQGLGFASRRNPHDSFLHEVSLVLAEPAPSAQRLPADWFSAR